MAREKVRGVLKKMKGRKGASLDGIAVEMMKDGSISVNNRLVVGDLRCTESRVASEDWEVVYIIPVYEGRGDRGGGLVY